MSTTVANSPYADLSYDELKKLYWKEEGERFSISNTADAFKASRARMEKYLIEKKSKEQEQDAAPDTTPDVKEFKGNRQGAKSIWQMLKTNTGMTADFESFLKNMQNNPQGRWAIHDLLVKNTGMTADFNAFNQNVFGDTPEDIAEEEVEEVAIQGPQAVDVFGVPIPLEEEVEEEKEEKDDPIEQAKNIQQEIADLMLKPILDANGNVDRKATAAKLAELQEEFPPLSVYKGEEYGPDGKPRPIVIEDIDLESDWEEFNNLPKWTKTEKENRWISWPKGYEMTETKESKEAKYQAGEDAKIATATDYENMLNNMYGKAGFKFKRKYTPKKDKGMGYGTHDIESKVTMNVEAPNGETLVVDFNAGWGSIHEQEIKDFIKANQIHKTEDQVAKEKEAFALWQKGELDIPTVCPEKDKTKCKDILTLDKIAKPNQEVIDYLRKNAPNMDEIAEDDVQAMQIAFNNTLNKVTGDDPRMKFITDHIQADIFKLANDKSAELRDSYDTNTQDGLEKAQDAFKEWYNTEFQTRLKDNKQAKQIYQEYGMAGQHFYADYAREYGRYNYDTWLDDNVLREIDANIGEGEEQGFFSKIRESMAMLPSSVKGIVNKVEVATQEGMEWEKRAKIFESMKEDFDRGTLKRDMTLEQARAINPEIDEWLKWTIHGWSNDDTLGEFYDTREKRYENTKADMKEDLDEMQEAEIIQGFFNQYHGDSWGDTVASAIQQAPHMAPTMLGSLLIAGGTASAVATGGAATGLAAGAIGTGKILLGVGSAVMAAQTYGDTFIEGTRRQMEEEFGEGGFTTEEYLTALAQEKYGAQLAPLLTAAAVGASEYLGGKLGGELVGTGVASIIKSKTGRALLGKTFSNFLGATAGTYAGMKGGALEEYLTEGFQSYLEQVGQNAMNLGEAGDMAGQGLNSAFTKNIDLDQIQMEARMGWNMGHLFGIGGLAGTFHGLSKQSLVEQARELVQNIDIQPGSSTGPALEQFFKNAAKKISDDSGLTKKQKRDQITELSNIREAALKIPAAVKGDPRTELMNLLDTQKKLKAKIKQVDNKTISESDGTIDQLNQTEERIGAIIEQATQEQDALEQGPTQAQGFLLSETQEDITADDISDQEALDYLDRLNEGRQRAGLDVELNTDEKIQAAKEELAANRNIAQPKNIETLAKEYKKDRDNVDMVDLLDQYQKIALKALGYDTQAGTIKRDQALSFVGEYFENILGSWDPAQGSLSNWITNNIAPKKSAFYGKEQQLKEKGKSTSLDDERAQELTAAETQETQGKEFEKSKYPTDIAAIEKQTADVRPEILTNIKNSVKQFIASSVGKVKEIGGKGKKIITKLNPSSLAKELKAQNKATRIAVRNAMGKSVKAQNDFIKNVINDGYIETIPIAAMKKRFKTVKGFNIEKIGRETLGAGTGIYKLSGLNKQALIDFYTKDQSGRRSFIDLLAKGLTIEQFQEVKIDTEFMNDLDFKLKEAKSELIAEEFMNEVERIYDGRTKEKRSLDKTESIRSKPKTAQEAAENAIKEIITEENKDNFKDKDVLDRAIEYFEGLDDNFKNTLGANPIQIFIKGIKAALKAIKLILKQGGTLKQAISDGLKVLKNELKFLFLSENKRFVKKIAEKFDFKNMESYPDLKAGGELSLKKILGFETADKNSKAYKELRKKEITKFLDSLPPTKREKYRRFLRESMAPSSRLNYSSQAEFDKDFPGPKPKRGEHSREKYRERNTTKRRFDQKFNNVIELIDSSEFQDEQDTKVDTLIEFFKDIGEYAAKNPESIPVWDSMINDAGNNMQHFIKTHAPIRFYPININTGKPSLNVSIDEEHSMPSQNVGRVLFLAGFTGQMDIISPVIKAGYMQGALLTKEHAKINTKEVGLKSSMNEAFDLVFKGLISGDIKQTQEGLSSLIRYVEGNFINPNAYRIAKTGKTVAEQFGVQVEKKYREAANVIVAQNKAITRILQGENKNKVLKDFKAWGEEIGIMQNTAAKKINKTAHTITDKSQTAAETKETLENSQDTQVNAQKINKKKKGISVFDFDDTLAKTKEQVLVKMPDGTLRRLTPAQFAEQADILAEQGAEFDFSQFENVKGAKKGPLADLALRRQGKFGSGDIFVLTARPQISARGIKTFLDGIGLNIPIENITGLEDGTSQAKADWVLQKTGEGYNDFYFADDSKMNVKAVKQILDQVDVKSKVQQAIADKETSLDKEFNEMLEETEGIKSQAEYSPVRAKLEGQKKDKGFFKWLGRQLTITPSAEDFLGLMYDLMGSGKQGNRHAAWIQDNLIKPYNKAEQTILSAKVAVANDFAALKKAFPSLRSSLKGNPLMDQIGVGPYTKSQAMRVYMWNKQGMEIPGLSKRDQNALVKAVENDMELMSFADNVILIQKDKQYPAPHENWAGGTIDGDLMFSIDQTLRRKVMTEFDENVKIIFSDKNMNKLEAIYGKKWVDALKDSLRRMQSGSNRPVYQGGGARIVNEMLDWLNGSVGAVMFLNVKSGLLQLISNVNFINWGDNNIYQAAKAFASKEYWPTVIKLMNSDYLVNRRDGLKINVNEAELANAAKDRGMKGAIAYLLDKGFIITRIMDSLAIATGGATFYINRRNALLERQNPETGKKYTQAEAEAKAFDDFYAISEESQQSSNPSKISQQQASLFGRVILAFQNVTMQYNRMTKKSIRDLYNRRKKPGMTQRESDMSNLSKIVYYTTVQNVIFNALQQALFAMLFDDETEEEEKDRLANIANGMADSLLFGLGFGGAAISTVKNVLLKVMEESDKKSPDYEEAVWEIFNVSPVLDSKVRKLRTTAKTFSWNMEEIKKRGWSLDNPTYLAVSQLISAATNIPLDRVLRKIMNMRMAMDEETRAWQRVALMLGWSSWSVGLPYWGLQSTIKREEEQKEKLKIDYKNDIRKLKAQGYKKVMYRNLKDFDPKNIIEMQSPAGTVVYYAKK